MEDFFKFVASLKNLNINTEKELPRKDILGR